MRGVRPPDPGASAGRGAVSNPPGESMRWEFGIGSIAGIRIRVHVTFVLLMAALPLWLGGSLRGALELAAVLGSVFACVLLHELGHALAARRYGIATREIVMLPIGGVARLERSPQRPAHEIVVALAGPAVNVLLATLISLALVAAGQSPIRALDHAADGLVPFLLFANLTMFAFNLVPAFPMDGGRVLRALMWLRLPYARATRYATIVGQAFALLFAVLGLFVLRTPSLVFIALFVFLAARDENAMVAARSAMDGLRVRAAMLTSFQTVETREALGHAVGLLMAGSQEDFPVLENGALLGMLSRADLLAALEREGEDAPVGRAARLDVPVLDPEEPLDRAIARMRTGRVSALPVMRRGELVGLLTLGNIGELLMVQQAMHRRSGTA